MHSKIIDPRRHGRFVFANRGSCSKTVSYLGHEARERGSETVFFNQDRADVSAEEVRESIDSNAKGLRKQQEKFYSLVLSPSTAELQHIGNDPNRLQAYTRQAMDNYARNATLRDGSKLASSELIWYATIHEQRTEKERIEEQPSWDSISTCTYSLAPRTAVRSTASTPKDARGASLSKTGR